MSVSRHTTCLLLLLMACGASWYPSAWAQEDSDATVSSELAIKQSKVADQYAQLEKQILRMAEFDQTHNPRRAELLKKAYALGKDQDIHLQLESVIRLLTQDQLKRAVDGQQDARADLQSLLDLLLAENRSDRVKDEQARVREYIKEIERLERMQRSVQGRSEGGVDPRQIAQEQKRVADRTRSLDQQIEENEAESAKRLENDGEDEEESPAAESEKDGDANDAQGGSESADDSKPRDDGTPAEEGSQQPNEGQPSEGQPSEGQPSEGQPSEGQPSEGQPSEGQPSEGQPSEGQPSEGQPSEGQPSEGQPSEGQPSEGQPSEGQPSEGQPSEGQPSEGQPSPNDQPPESFPGRQEIQQAERKMREAQRKLDQAKREGALDDQKEAARKLAEAKAKLEQILRQLREEEIERMLAMLESRLRKMLEMQLRVYEGTIRLEKIPDERRDRVLDIEAGKLSFAQRKIVVEAHKCLNLLREEASSVAFPETVDQMRGDMESVAERLSRSQVGEITQGLEEDILEALDEMIEALHRAQQEQEQRKNQPQAPGQTDPGDLPLVDALAEIRMIKALQLRINRRTNRYSRMLDDIDDPVGQSADADLAEALGELSVRESKLHRITRDLSLGKNK